MSHVFKETRQFQYAHPSLNGDSDEIKRQANILKYVEHLGGVTGTDVSEWPIDIFANEETGRLFFDRQKINEKFFEFKETADKSSLLKITPEQLVKISDAEARLKSFALSEAVRLELRLQSIQADISDLSRRIEDRIRDAQTLNDNIKSLRAIPSDGLSIGKEIERIIDKGFWELLEIGDGSFYFVTKLPVTISYFNDVQARQNSVCLGKLKAKLFLTHQGTFDVRVYKHEGAAHNNSFAHPHVNMEGVVCFGELLAQFNIQRSKQDICGMMITLSSVVKAYNEGDAYQAIYDFTNEEGREEDEEESEEDYEDDHYDDEPEYDEDPF